jgi:O-antigen ligase
VIEGGDGLTGGLLLAGLVFMPWAFGTTQPWAISVMNGVAYLLGGLLIFKRIVARFGRFRPARWTDGQPASAAHRIARLADGAMAGLTVLLLAYCLVAALNARAVVVHPSWTLAYRECIAWLPHSYDQAQSWREFWMYLGWASLFWAARDWLGGLSRRETVQRLERIASDPMTREPGLDASVLPPRQVGIVSTDNPYRLPDRLRWLLYVLCLNGALIAAQGLVQRSTGSNHLLWMVEPRYNKSLEGQFGPYANRNNAAEYLNLVSPLCAALAWLQARARRHARRHGLRWRGLHAGWFIAGAVIMGAAPYITASRGGALVASGLILGVGVLVTMANQGRRWPVHLGLVLLSALTLQLAIVVGFDKLMERFETMFVDDLSGRLQVYEHTRRMALDHPWFGTGPGSYQSLYQFYRGSHAEPWEAYVHNDWLELRVTLGGIGFGLALTLLALVPLRWWCGSGPGLHWLLPAALCCALAGCLVHARFDFPFRIYSITGTFLVLAAVLCVHGRRPAT